MADYDAIVVGGGHNGLVAAAYLARAGAKPIVLEARHKTGGAATTDTPWPDAPQFKVTTLSYVMSLMPPTIIRDLDLERHGYKVHPMNEYYLAFPDGTSLKMFGDDSRHDRDEIAKFSAKDAEAQGRWEAWLGGLAEVLGPLLMQVPPKVGSRRPRDLVDQLMLVWRMRGLDVRTVGDVTRLMTMSIADLLDDWFESPQIKAAHAINGIIGTWAGPAEPGTAYVMAHHSIGDVGDGRLGSWGFPEGGMGAVSAAIRRSAEALGATVRTNAPVERILVRNGRAVGVALASGEELHSDIVVASTHPKTTFLRMIDSHELPDEFVHDIERWKTRSGVVKINLALAELPDFTADPGVHPAVHGGAIELAHSVEYLEQAFQDARAGRPAERPFSDGCIPSFYDRTLCPEGTHIMSLFTQWVPHEWSQEPHTEELEAYADRVIDGYTELAPNLKGAVLHRQVIGPYQMEKEWGLIGGNIFHGELSAEQLFHMRPAPGYADYRTPLRGLYQCSSATHAGGGVCGIPGHHAVRAIMADRRSLRPSRRRFGAERN
ncbi:MAG TPA: NAD(P)/FAD-dependent oxidoreductase [Actinomycetota bacterium]|nr:NAD(P)/FAD-dependent oxidoreductase [Actinomycetota bacterium]